jgi:hypothetical protein
MKLLLTLLALVLFIGCAAQQKRIARMPTAELKLRRQQLIEEITQPQGFRLSGFRPGTEGHQDAMDEKNKIEFELLRRWKAGDKGAYLPQFSR